MSADNPLVSRTKLRSIALALLKRRLMSTRSDEQKDVDRKAVQACELLKGWDYDSTGVDDTKDRIAKLQAEQDEDLKQLETAADPAAGDEAAVVLLKASQKDHGKMSDEELTSAIGQLDEQLAEINTKREKLGIEQNRRTMVKSLADKLDIKTGMDRAILDQVINPGRSDKKTKVSGTN